MAKRAETIATQPLDTFWNSQRMIGLERSQCVSLMIKPSPSILENKIFVSSEGKDIGSIQRSDPALVSYDLEFLRGDCNLVRREAAAEERQHAGWLMQCSSEELAFFATAPESDEVYFTVAGDKYKFSHSGCFATRNGDAVASFFSVGNTALVHFMAIDKSVPDVAKAIMCNLAGFSRAAKVT